MNLLRFNQRNIPPGLYNWTTKIAKDGTTEHSFQHGGHTYYIVERGQPLDEDVFAAWFNEYASKVPYCEYCGVVPLPSEPTTTDLWPDGSEHRGHVKHCLGPYARGHAGVFDATGTFISDRYGPSQIDPVTGVFIAPLEQPVAAQTED